MPLVRIEIQAGFDAGYKKAIMDAVHDSLVTSLKIPDTDRRQRLTEYKPQDFEHTGRSEKYTIIEITMFLGRSPEAKRDLYKTLNAKLVKNPGIPAEDITIVIHEPPLENWGIRGGFAASDIDLGFKINV